MKLTKDQVQKDLDALPEHYKTGDVDRLIRQYVKQKADVSALRPYILGQQQFHRIYYFVTLDQIRNAEERMAFHGACDQKMYRKKQRKTFRKFQGRRFLSRKPTALNNVTYALGFGETEGCIQSNGLFAENEKKALML